MTAPDSIDSHVAIIGMDGRFPMSDDLGQWWENLRQGAELLTSLSREEILATGCDPGLLADVNYVRMSGKLAGVEFFDGPFFGYSPREAETLDPQHRFFLECAYHALENAGYVPASYGGRIGVYAGQTISGYWLNNIIPSGSSSGPTDLSSAMGSLYDFLATKASYKLNLKGPSLNVQAACATSLVAVHIACQSVLGGECDLALAGGVSITVPQAGYLYQEGGILSPDGHCRSFDAKAHGTVGGSGVGIIVLKRLTDALRDRDTIHAVIRGSAVNNDGWDKVGYTAPGVDGQTQVIREALAVAGVAPESVTYIEGHGTATQLGDPVELTALSKAFGGAMSRPGRCALGSVKSNMGHLDAAAGIAGLMKAVLQLRYRELVPSLHFEAPNPKIDLAATPFYVNTQLIDWRSSGHPRRAGVNSFGIGGTNAHVVLEEPPDLEPSGPSREWQAVLVSAKTSTAADRTTQVLADFLARHADTNLADAAYTTQVGRVAYAHRRALVCRTNGDAADALQGRALQRMWSTESSPERHTVAFMFPGQGSQYPGMGSELYSREPAFRREIDRCAEVLLEPLGIDLRTILFDRTDEQNSEQALVQTRITQPALFAIEYALARLWMTWGIMPDAMIGHSIGEYVAACLAGVFSLEDALQIVAARGRMIQDLPAGGMLAVDLTETEAARFVGADLSLAAVNAKDLCVLSGSFDAVERAERQLRDEGRDARRLRTSHAFHSGIMDPAIRSFTELLSRFQLSAPVIPYVSNVTGTWIRAEEATDPCYWGRHLRGTVRFGDGINTVLRAPERILMEVGPGQTLANLARRDSACGKTRIVQGTMPRAQDSKGETEVAVSLAARLWVNGIDVDWQAFSSHERRRRIPLPGYSFDRHKYWIKRPSQKATNLLTAETTAKDPDPGNWFYAPSWTRTASLPLQPAALTEPLSWLLLMDDVGLGGAIARGLRATGHDVAIVTAGPRFARLDAETYSIDPQLPEDYAAVLRELRRLGKTPRHVMHLWSVTAADRDGTEEKVRTDIDRGFFSLVFLAQALGKELPGEPIDLTVISSGIHDVTGEEPLQPAKATLLGPCLVIPQEAQTISCRNIDIETKSIDASPLADQLIADVAAKAADQWVAYRGGHRWVQTYQSVRVDSPEPATVRLRERGVYVITGGLGNIGLAIAEFLARVSHARLVLLGRSALPERGDWDLWLKTHASDNPTNRRIERLKKIEQLGGELLVLTADVTDREQLRRAIDSAARRFGAINGVVHAAGSLAEADLGYVQELRRPACERQFAAKIYGLHVLEECLRGTHLDFCVLLSSLSAVLGGLAFAPYAAANRYMDAFVHKHNRANSSRWTSVNWDSWNFGNMQQAGGIGSGLAAFAMTPEEGTEAFRRILSRPELGQIVVSTGRLEGRIRQWVNPGAPTDGKDATQEGEPMTYPRPQLQSTFVEPRNEVDRAIVKVWQRFLGVDQIGIHDDFFDLGGHSLMATQVFSRLKEVLRIQLSLREFFEATTVAQLSDRIVAGEAQAGMTEKIARLRATVESMSSEDVVNALQHRT